MAHLSLSLLGPFIAKLDGENLSGFRSDKVRALLSYLAVGAHRPWPRTVLADLLWPEFPEKAALSNLRNALSNLRHVIGDHRTDIPFLRISQANVQFDSASDRWLDVAAFIHLTLISAPQAGALSSQVDIVRLEKALALYRGEFMEDFSIASAPFEEWVLVKQEQMRQRLLQCIRHLAIAHEERGDLAAALECTQRWIEIETYDEAAYRQRMRILAAYGQRSAALIQYEELRGRLAKDLGINPELETVQVYEQIRGGQPGVAVGPDVKVMELSEGRVIDPGPLPQFLLESIKVEGEARLFVGRQAELEQLANALERTIGGGGRAYFVTGEPGCGKTALLAEFSRQAMRMCPNLLVLWGQCNAYTGQGDAFFPFLNITRMLAGEVDPLLAGGVITQEHAERLWRFLPDTIVALLEDGPQLISRFLVAGDRMSLARFHPGVNSELLERLDTGIKNPSVPQGRPGSLQSALLEQFAQVVTALSRHHPLMIVLDDLQWIDSGSVNMLFHLGRRLEGSKVLLLGAYRSEEVALGREGTPHPLEAVVQELQAVSGEILVDLMRSDGADFIQALLDSEPNELSPEFRRMLLHRTSGHPLFAIELLRGMQLRGEIIRGKKGKWIEGMRLNWDELPARVEAVIARRIRHLSDECQELLNVACVEGEQFHAEIVARALGKDEQRVGELLSQEIGRRHRLVAAQGLKHIGEARLSTYRFMHSLFQIYLYGHLDPVEKAGINGKIGRELDQVYCRDESRLPEIAHALARHFEIAGVTQHAVRYYTLAGKNALRLSASQEAIAHFYHALNLLESLPASAERDQQELELQLSLGPPLTALKGWAPAEMAVAYERAQELCQNISDHAQLIPALWLLSVYRVGRSEHDEVDRLIERLYRLAVQAGDPALLSLASIQVSPFYRGKFGVARQLLERAAASRDLDQQRFLALRYGMAPAVVGLAYLAECLWFLGLPEQADQVNQEARALAEQVMHPLTTCYALARSCWLSACKGDGEALRSLTEKFYPITQKYGFKNFEFAVVFFKNWANAMLGDPARQRIENMQRAIEDYRADGTVLNRTAFLVLFGLACRKVGQVERGLAAIDESITLAQETGECWYLAEAYRAKGELLARRAEAIPEGEAELEEAENCFLLARQIAGQQQAKALELRIAIDLCRLWRKLRGPQAGKDDLQHAYDTFTEGFETPDLRRAKALLDG